MHNSYCLQLKIRRKQGEIIEIRTQKLATAEDPYVLNQKANKITQYLDALTQRDTHILDMELEVIEETSVHV